MLVRGVVVGFPVDRRPAIQLKRELRSHRDIYARRGYVHRTHDEATQSGYCRVVPLEEIGRRLPAALVALGHRRRRTLVVEDDVAEVRVQSVRIFDHAPENWG